MTSSFYKGRWGIVILYKIKYSAVQSEKLQNERLLGDPTYCCHTCYTLILRALENVEFLKGGVSLNFNKEKKRKKN